MLPRPPPTEDPVRVAAGTGAPDSAVSSWLRALSFRGLPEALVIPLVMAGENKGSLFVARGHSPGFSDADEKVLARVRPLLGSSVPNAGLHLRAHDALPDPLRSPV